MKIRVSLLPGLQMVADDVDVAIVIDVLRFTSSMTTALANRAAVIHACESIDQAHRVFADLQDSDRLASASERPLLCGERSCQRIDGFDLGNSPAEYSSDVVQGRHLIATTTNGTRAIAQAGAAKAIHLASFLNLSSVVQSIASAKIVQLVCAGTEGEITREDVLLAGAIVCRCQSVYEAVVEGDQGLLARDAWIAHFDPVTFPTPELLANALAQTTGGRNLIRVGYEDDLLRCAQLDVFTVVPVRISGKLDDGLEETDSIDFEVARKV